MTIDFSFQYIENPNTFPCIEMKSLLLWSIVSLIKSIVMKQ